MDHIFNVWNFRLFGKFDGTVEFKDEATGELRRYISLLYFGVKQSVPIDESEFCDLSNVDLGLEMRLNGHISFRNGIPRFRIASYSIQGMRNFSALTPQEKLAGSDFLGYGQVQRLLQNKYEDVVTLEVELAVMGEPVILPLFSDVFRCLQIFFSWHVLASM